MTAASRVLAGPVALQLDLEGDPADRLPAGLDHAVKAGAVGSGEVPPIASTTGRPRSLREARRAR